jgi:ABC-type transport system involved in multi-copper enzyme maturation permease subunit
MNWTLVKNTLHRLLSRPVTVLVLIGYSFYVLISLFSEAAAGGGQSLSQSAWFLTWALGTGLLGSERSDGYLPLLLSRPISRAQYVCSRWAGLVICVLAIDLVLHLAALALFSNYQMAPQAGALAQRWLWFCYFVPLCAALIVLLSALFSGHGDLIYFVAGSLGISYLSSKLGLPLVAEQVTRALGWLWMPGKATLEAWSSGAVLQSVYSATLFIVWAGVCLSVAAYVMQRRDVSYVNR